MKKWFLIIAMPILVLSTMYAAMAIELEDFDPSQYEYTRIDHVDIYLGLTFGMKPDEVFDTAQRQGTLLDRNEYMETYAMKGEARVEGYLGTIVFYSFWEDSETLAQFDCVFNESRTFNTVEKALTKKYGESPYNSENHRRLPDIHTGELHSYPTKSQDISDYSQRLIQTDDNTYVIIHHYMDGTFAPYLYLHCMTITQIETNQNAKQIGRRYRGGT